MGADPLSFEAFLKMILSVLEKADIDDLIGGSVAAWSWGEPRSTQDVDLVIHLGVEQVNALSRELKEAEIYLPPDIILGNFQEDRVDLPLNAIHGYVHSPEDLILSKLHYYSLGHQTKHIRDIGGILKTMGERLDHDYIQTWAKKKQLTAIWEEIEKQLPDF